jgi:predicted lipid-binding transport protein (Tim44 family)
MTMTRTFAAAAILVALIPSVAFAQHRGGDAALGALSGAVVLGPVGAVAGAIVGYTAGPAIAHSLGLRDRRSARDRRYRTRNAAAPAGGASRESKVSAAPMESNARLATVPANPTAATPVAQAKPVAGGKMPPVQALE